MLRNVGLNPGHVHEEGEHGLLHQAPHHLVPGQKVLLDSPVLAQQRLLASKAFHPAEGSPVHAGQGRQRCPHVGQLTRPLVNLRQIEADKKTYLLLNRMKPENGCQHRDSLSQGSR